MTLDEMLKYLEYVGDQSDYYEVRSNAIAAKLRAAEELVELVRNASETWPKLKGAIRRYDEAGGEG